MSSDIARGVIAKLKEENAALREDKERLDWLCSTEGGRWAYWHLLGDDCVDRSVIDAARKEPQQ